MQAEFPDIINLSVIGKSFENRDIMLVTLDAREDIVKKQMTGLSQVLEKHEHNHLHKKGFKLS